MPQHHENLNNSNSSANHNSQQHENAEQNSNLHPAFITPNSHVTHHGRLPTLGAAGIESGQSSSDGLHIHQPSCGITNPVVATAAIGAQHPRKSRRHLSGEVRGPTIQTLLQAGSNEAARAYINQSSEYRGLVLPSDVPTDGSLHDSDNEPNYIGRKRDFTEANQDTTDDSANEAPVNDGSPTPKRVHREENEENLPSAGDSQTVTAAPRERSLLARAREEREEREKIEKREERRKQENREERKKRGKRSSRFLEGSMNDRVSQQPPAAIVGEDGDGYTADISDESSAHRPSGESFFTFADPTTPKPSTMYRFGSAIKALNPMSALKSINKFWTRSSTVTDPNKAKTEAMYQELSEIKAMIAKMPAQQEMKWEQLDRTRSIVQQMYTDMQTQKETPNQGRYDEDSKQTRAFVERIYAEMQERKLTADTHYAMGEIAIKREPITPGPIQPSRPFSPEVEYISTRPVKRMRLHSNPKNDAPTAVRESMEGPPIKREKEATPAVLEQMEGLEYPEQAVERNSTFTPADYANDSAIDLTNANTSLEEPRPTMLNSEQAPASARSLRYGLRSMASKLNLASRKERASPPRDMLPSQRIQRKKSEALLAKQKRAEEKIERLKKQSEKAEAEREACFTELTEVTAAQIGDESLGPAPVLSDERRQKSPSPSESPLIRGRSTRRAAAAAPEVWRTAYNLTPPVPKVPAKYKEHVAKVGEQAEEQKAEGAAFD